MINYEDSGTCNTTFEYFLCPFSTHNYIKYSMVLSKVGFLLGVLETGQPGTRPSSSIDALRGETLTWWCPVANTYKTENRAEQMKKFVWVSLEVFRPECRQGSSVLVSCLQANVEIAKFNLKPVKCGRCPPLLFVIVVLVATDRVGWRQWRLLLFRKPIHRCSDRQNALTYININIRTCTHTYIH
jgi:hypothetical protein